jgi:hypothetical protein
MAYQIPVGKSEEKKPLQKSMFRCDGVNCIDKPAQRIRLWPEDRDERRAALVAT